MYKCNNKYTYEDWNQSWISNIYKNIMLIKITEIVIIILLIITIIIIIKKVIIIIMIIIIIIIITIIITIIIIMIIIITEMIIVKITIIMTYVTPEKLQKIIKMSIINQKYKINNRKHDNVTIYKISIILKKLKFFLFSTNLSLD